MHMYLTDNEVECKFKQADEALYTFDENSTYIQNPPFFEGLSKEPDEVEPLNRLTCSW